MDSSILAAFSALGGAIIGALASFSSVYFTQRQEAKRALRRELINAALAHWNKRLEHSAKFTGEPVAPAQDFIIDFLYLERLISKGISDASVPEIIAELGRQQALYTAIINYRNKEIRRTGQCEEDEEE